jgi:hypothetical protein
VQLCGSAKTEMYPVATSVIPRQPPVVYLEQATLQVNKQPTHRKALWQVVDLGSDSWVGSPIRSSAKVASGRVAGALTQISILE